ncbi:hypothetical protein [Paenibacillus thermotolerans]|uniref:hypothetical protein n=1 Tax=Paenibacillus thermotolerans TaxID=3027807 RepID=UPI0030823064
MKDSSLQSQNPISQAQESVVTAHHAVKQAQTHPAERMIAQAENSIEHAERSIAQAGDAELEPVQRAQQDLEEDKNSLNSLKQ